MSSGVGELGRGGDLPFCQPYRQDAQVSLGLNEQGPSLGQCLSWLRGSFAQADRGRTCARRLRMNMRVLIHLSDQDYVPGVSWSITYILMIEDILHQLE